MSLPFVNFNWGLLSVAITYKVQKLVLKLYTQLDHHKAKSTLNNHNSNSTI